MQKKSWQQNVVQRACEMKTKLDSMGRCAGLRSQRDHSPDMGH